MPSTFSKLGKALPDGAQLRVTNVIVAGDMAVGDLVSDATARNGIAGLPASVSAFLDSTMVTELFRQNQV